MSTTPTIPQLIAELQRQGFYGSLEVKFEAGRIVLLRKTETFKPTEENDYRTSRGIDNDQR